MLAQALVVGKGSRSLVEMGYPNSSLIFVLAGPKGLPPAVDKRITDAFVEAMHTPAYIEFATKTGMLMKKPLTGEALRRYLMDDRAAMGAIAAKMGFSKKK